MPWPKKNVIFDSNFNSKKQILHFLSSKCHGVYQFIVFALFSRTEYEGDSGVMSYDLGHKKCRIKVFVMFYYLDGKNGSLFRFADVKPYLGNLSKYRGIQQEPNIQSVFHKRWRKQ